MSAKLSSSRAGQTTASVSVPSTSVDSTTSYTQPSLTLDSELLCSFIQLPDNYAITYACFSSEQADSHQTIDGVRKQLFDSYASCTIEDSVLSYTQISGNERRLWLFSINDGSSENGSVMQAKKSSRLSDLAIDGLTRSNIEMFRYYDLYSCSSSCSLQRYPCPTCHALSQSPSTPVKPSNGQTSSSYTPDNITYICGVPREALRRPVSFFIKAVRHKLLYDICKKFAREGKCVLRLKEGLIWSLPNSKSRWTGGWDQCGTSRPLPFCYPEITIFPSGLLVSPLIKETCFVPFLPTDAPLPGTPIQLLPFSTPAYYLNMYAGPTSALVKQFHGSLKSYVPEELLQDNKDFVIIWISLENKQGDEKGIMAIWPACLCLCLLSTADGPREQSSDCHSFAYDRRFLPTLPEMPLALQPSPVPAHAAVPAQRLTSPSIFTTGDSGLFSSKEPSPQLDFLPTNTDTYTISSTRKLKRISATRVPRAFRATASRYHDSSELAEAALRAGTYVDAIVKERERERDRKRKERETSVSAGVAAKDSPAQHVLDSPDVSLASFQQLPTPGNMGFSSIHTPNSTTLTAAQLVSSPAYASPLATQIAQPTYPSPPDDIISRERSISHPLSADFTAAGLAFQQQTMPKSESFDNFGTMDNLMADITLGYNMGPDKMLNQGLTTTISMGQGQDDFGSFGAFTEDDFNFFDDPISTSAITAYPNEQSVTDSFLPAQIQSSTDNTSEALLNALDISPVFPTDFFNSLPVPIAGPNDLAPTPTDLPTLATPSTSINGEAKDIVLFTAGYNEAPDLAHSPSDQSSMSPTGPLTPDAVSMPSSEVDTDDLFQPIHFRKNLQMTDAKYMSGKFSSSSIVPELEEELLAGIPNWRGSYSLATDPGTGIVKKLVGMKRRQMSQGCRQTSDVPSKNGAYDDVFSVSDEETDDEGQQDTDTDESDVESDNAISSRPSTPLPSYVPPGPSLVATQLSYSLLFPISVSLRPAGAPFSDQGLPSPIANAVPTPISPSANGGRSRNTKATELLANALCSELIENAVWADDWRALQGTKKRTERRTSCSDHGDVYYNSKYMLSGGYFVNSMSISKILDFVDTNSTREGTSNDLVSIPQPVISVGKASSVVNTAPTALRFWSKLGLAPRSGEKDVVAFVVHEEGNGMSHYAEAWLRRVSVIYKLKGYGSHIVKKMPGCEKEGLLPLHYATLRKTFNGVLDEITAQSHLPVLLYVVTSTTNMATKALRQVLTVLKSASTDKCRNINYHLIPSSLLFAENDNRTGLRTERITDDVYNKIKRPVSRFTSRTVFIQNEEEQRFFEAPAYVLSRGPICTKLLFSDHASSSADIVERHTFLHVGYWLSACQKWLIVAILDQRGESHDLKLWHGANSYSDEQIVNLVWSFAMDFAAQAKVEWRLTISKLGPFGCEHLEAWNTRLSSLTSSRRTIPIHVTLLSVEESGWSITDILSPSRSVVHVKDQTLKNKFSFSSSAHKLSRFLKIPLSTTRVPELSVGLNHIIEDDGDESVDYADRILPMRTAVLFTPSTSNQTPTYGLFIHMLACARSPFSTLTCSDSDTHEEICQSFYELAVLTRLRWCLPTCFDLPFHIAALRVADEIVEHIDSVLDS